MGHGVSHPGGIVRICARVPEPPRHVAHGIDRSHHGACLPRHPSQPVGSYHRPHALRHRSHGRILPLWATAVVTLFLLQFITSKTVMTSRLKSSFLPFTFFSLLLTTSLML